MGWQWGRQQACLSSLIRYDLLGFDWTILRGSRNPLYIKGGDISREELIPCLPQGPKPTLPSYLQTVFIRDVNHQYNNNQTKRTLNLKHKHQGHGHKQQMYIRSFTGHSSLDYKTLNYSAGNTDKLSKHHPYNMPTVEYPACQWLICVMASSHEHDLKSIKHTSFISFIAYYLSSVRRNSSDA